MDYYVPCTVLQYSRGSKAHRLVGPSWRWLCCSVCQAHSARPGHDLSSHFCASMLAAHAASSKHTPKVEHAVHVAGCISAQCLVLMSSALVELYHIDVYAATCLAFVGCMLPNCTETWLAAPNHQSIRASHQAASCVAGRAKCGIHFVEVGGFRALVRRLAASRAAWARGGAGAATAAHKHALA
jgi:hypothetical protein